MARRAAPTSDVVIVDRSDGSTEYVKAPTIAAQLTTEPVPVIETKDLTVPVPAPVYSCDTCGRPAGRGADGKIVLLFQRSDGTICTDCAAEQHAKAIADEEMKGLLSHSGQLQGMYGPVGRKKRKPARSTDEPSPSELARQHSNKRRLGVPESYKPKAASGDTEEKVEDLATTLSGLVAQAESMGLPIAQGTRDALAAATKAMLSTSPVSESFEEFVQRTQAEFAALPHVPTVQQIVEVKMAPFVAREEKVARVVESVLAGEGFVMPTGYSSIEQVEYQLQKSFDARKAEMKAARKF